MISSNFFESLPKLTKIPYYGFWITFCCILLLVMITTAKSIQGENLQFYLPGLIMLGAAWLSIAIVWSYNKLIIFTNQIHEISKTPEKTKAWLHKYIEQVYSSKKFVISGLFVSIILILLVGICSNWLTQPYPWYESIFSRVFFFVLWGTATFFAGSGLVVVFWTMIIPFKLSKDKLRLTLHGHRRYGIKRVGNIYFQFSMVIAGAAFISIMGVFVSPLRQNLALILMYMIWSCISIVYFFITQWVLHNALVQEKVKLLDDISEILERKLNYLRNKSSTEGEKRIDNLLSIRKEIISLSEWPFDAIEVIKVISSTLGPILVIIAKFWDLIAPVLSK